MNNKLTRLLSGFLSISDADSERRQALRLLTLQMLAGGAQDFFQANNLATELNKLLNRWENVAFDFDEDLEVEDALARIDICYVLSQRGKQFEIVEVDRLVNYLHYLQTTGNLIYAWLAGEMLYQCGLDVRIRAGLRPYKDRSQYHDLYWITHQFLLATNYLQRSLPRIGWDGRAEELIASLPFLIDHQFLDLGAEVVLCLTLANKPQHQYQQLLALLEKNINDQGTVIDPTSPPTADNIAHTTAATLLALALLA